MNIVVKRVLAFIAGTSAVCLLAWAAGFDFNERGELAFLVTLLGMCAGVFGATYPFEEK